METLKKLIAQIGHYFSGHDWGYPDKLTRDAIKTCKVCGKTKRLGT